MYEERGLRKVKLPAQGHGWEEVKPPPASSIKKKKKKAKQLISFFSVS